MLETKELVKVYSKRKVVNSISICMECGEIVGLLGPNGAGKTTTFYMLMGLVKPDSGTVIFDSKDITKSPMYKRARQGLGYLPQESSIFKKLTVEEKYIDFMGITLIPSKARVSKRLDPLLDENGIIKIEKIAGNRIIR